MSDLFQQEPLSGLSSIMEINGLPLTGVIAVRYSASVSLNYVSATIHNLVLRKIFVHSIFLILDTTHIGMMTHVVWWHMGCVSSYHGGYDDEQCIFFYGNEEVFYTDSEYSNTQIYVIRP